MFEAMIYLIFILGVCIGFISALIFLYFCNRGVSDRTHNDMLIFHGYWQEANRLAKERNEIARGRND